MNLFGLVPENSDSRLKNQVETEISKWLKDSGFEADTKIRQRLSDCGIRGSTVLANLAQIKSHHKYKYTLDSESVHHILKLAQSQPILQKFIQDRPYRLAKAAVIYEHAPTFLFGGKASQKQLDNCLINFAQNYISEFWEYSVKPEGLPLTSAYRVLECTFWDSELWHPAAYLKRAYEENLSGVEYCIDFHPFQVNLNKLLPEDFNDAHRALIREWVERMNLELSLHSAIVGPYSEPNFMGTQLYYDPVDAPEVQKETILLAKDIGASSVVVHLVDPNRLPQLAEIIETAAGSQVRVTLENYYYTEKINQTSEAFTEALDALLPLLTQETQENNFGITFDPGHYNIEGDDPIIAAARLSQWCKENGVHFTKIHATTNYGPLQCFPPNFSSDVHDRVFHLGIDNQRVIQLVRSAGHTPSVTAEQIQPMIERDTRSIDDAQRFPVEDYKSIVPHGKTLLRRAEFNELMTPADAAVEAYQFVAGLSGLEGLQKYLVFRRIQQIEEMTSETAQVATELLMKASVESQCRAVAHLPKILKSVIQAEGEVSRDSINAICEKLHDALLAEIQREDLNLIFAESIKYRSGEAICHQGAIGDEMFYIKSGRAQVLVADTQIAELELGDIFGEISLFYDVPRSATVKAAIDDTEIGVLKRSSLVASLNQQKDSAKTLLFRLYTLLPERLRSLNAKYTHASRILEDLNPEVIAQLEDGIDDSLTLNPSFQVVDSEELDAIFSENREYAPGEIVFPQDTIGDGAYLIKTGSVRVIRSDTQRPDTELIELMDKAELEKIFSRDAFYTPQESVSHENMLLARLGRKEIIGEIALIDEADRSATIVSEGATLGYLSKKDFDQIIELDSELSYKFLLTLCSTMASRISRLNQAYLKVVSEIRQHRTGEGVGSGVH